MQQLPPFKLEQYFTKYEFTAPYLLCMSDCESYGLKELLAHADDECLTLWDELSLAYTETQGLPLLREAIAQQYESLRAEDVLCHAGAEEAIYCVMRSLIEEGDHVVVVTPCYQSLEALPHAAGAEVTAVELSSKQEWALDLDQLTAAVRPTTKLIVMNYPHNPTGALLTPEEQQAIVELARINDAFVLCDEVYRLMEVDSRDRLPPIADVYERGISINVMTKAFGLAGLRIGWVASQSIELIQSTALYKNYTSICNAATSEILALIALRNAETLLARNHQLMSANLELLDQLFLEKKELLTWNRPKGGCIGFVEVNPAISVEKLAQDLVKEAGVLILPSSIYDYAGNHFRIGFGRQNMHIALSRFRNYIETNLSHIT